MLARIQVHLQVMEAPGVPKFLLRIGVSRASTPSRAIQQGNQGFSVNLPSFTKKATASRKKLQLLMGLEPPGVIEFHL
jgi:hypothetical protein